jgi:hypothetical protein
VALRDFNPFAGRKDPTPTPTPALAAALTDLGRLTTDRPDLAPAGLLLARVLSAAFRAPVPEVALHADSELVLDAWRAGVPAFRAGDAPPALDRDDLRSRGLAVVEALLQENPGARPCHEAIRNGSADLHAWALDALADRAEAIDARAEALGIAPALARSVLRLALLPTLSTLSDKLATIRPSAIWRRGECPHCGSPPSLAESRGLEQRRYWRCGLCAAGWEGERLRCPFCGETDHHRLHYQFVEGEQDRYRLALCDGCGGSIKVVATLGPVSAPGLLVAELATAHLEPSISE